MFRISFCDSGGKHSSSPSIITRRERFANRFIGTWFIGSTIRAFICVAGVWDRSVGSYPTAERTISRISGMDLMSCQTIVATSLEWSLRPWAVREKKKLAARSASHSSAMDCAIADFPAPAGPYIQKTRRPPFSGRSFTQASIFARIASRVFGWHFGGSNLSAELWKAPTATCSCKVSSPGPRMDSSSPAHPENTNIPLCKISGLSTLVIVSANWNVPPWMVAFVAPLNIYGPCVLWWRVMLTWFRNVKVNRKEVQWCWEGEDASLRHALQPSVCHEVTLKDLEIDLVHAANLADWFHIPWK